MNLLLPFLAFGLVFIGMLAVMRRSQRNVARLGRHEIAAVASGGAAVPQVRSSILADVRKSGAVGKLAAKASSGEVRSKSAELLLQAGSPMPLGTYLLVRAGFTFALTPLGILYVYRDQGFTTMGIPLMVFVGFAFPNLAPMYVKRKARKRAKEIERAMPDALDLLVVCVEGGLSLDGGLHQVAQRTGGLLAAEFRRLLGEISTGMARRDALQALAARSTSQSLAALCASVIQADKMGVSIAKTLRTLSETLRTRRRQEAETQARKAPIKMMPFLVFFMFPAIFIVILGPIVIGIMEMFRATGS